MGTYKLYGYWRSSASWRIRWAFEFKKIKYEYIPVNLLKGEHSSAEHIKRNPSGKVPVFETLDSHFLTQSVAILEYLEELHHTPSLLPSSAFDKALCRALCEIINADVAPLQTPLVQKRHSSDPAEQLKWTQEWIRKGFTAFEKLLPKSRGPFCFGDHLSLADLFLVPQIYNAVRYQISVESEYPTLWKIYQAALQTEACHKAAPEQQTDATL